MPFNPLTGELLFVGGTRSQEGCRSRLRRPSYPFVVSLTRMTRGFWYLLKASPPYSGGQGRPCPRRKLRIQSVPPQCPFIIITNSVDLWCEFGTRRTHYIVSVLIISKSNLIYFPRASFVLSRSFQGFDERCSAKILYCG